MPAGRPSLYTPELLEKAYEYLEVWDAGGDQVIPSIAGLALHIGVCRDTCHAWVKDEEKEKFSDIYKEVMMKQEVTLANKGLTGAFNSTITKLMMTKHNYSDKQELSGPEGAPIALSDLTDADLEARLRNAMDRVDATS